MTDLEQFDKELIELLYLYKKALYAETSPVKYDLVAAVNTYNDKLDVIRNLIISKQAIREAAEKLRRPYGFVTEQPKSGYTYNKALDDLKKELGL